MDTQIFYGSEAHAADSILLINQVQPPRLAARSAALIYIRDTYQNRWLQMASKRGVGANHPALYQSYCGVST